MSDSAPKRRWFRWSLRTMFVVMTFAGAALWLWPQIAWIRERHRAAQHYTGVVAEGRAAAPWSLRILGENGVERITIQTTREEFFRRSTLVMDREQQMRAIFPEAEIVSIETD